MKLEGAETQSGPFYAAEWCSTLPLPRSAQSLGRPSSRRSVSAYALGAARSLSIAGSSAAAWSSVRACHDSTATIDQELREVPFDGLGAE